MTFKQYKIYHLNLELGVDSVKDENAKACYCVFWYKSIPLGQCYLDVKQASSSQEFFEACVNAITPALVHYSGDDNIKSSLNRITPEGLPLLLSRIFENAFSGGEDLCDVSVIICTRNRAAYLKNCLAALQNQVWKPAEIIVVDNGSSTRETKLVARQLNVRYIREDKVGLDVARNTGARAARHSVIAFVDDDTLPDPSWTFRVCETFKDPEVSAMTGLVLAGSLETEAEVIFEKYWPFNRGFVPKYYGDEFFQSTLRGGPPVWKIGAGANMAFRRSVFEDVGYFDERLDAGAAGCSGDSELWYRILANGLSIQYNPLAVVHHFHRSTVTALKRQLYSYMRGFTVAILIQYERFGHKGNLSHLFKALPKYYLGLIRRGFPFYNFQYQTVFAEIGGVFAGMVYYLRHKNTNPRIYLGP
jgi:glycosyltransferase involved in cell wall biosynthesis